MFGLHSEKSNYHLYNDLLNKLLQKCFVILMPLVKLGMRLRETLVAKNKKNLKDLKGEKNT